MQHKHRTRTDAKGARADKQDSIGIMERQNFGASFDCRERTDRYRVDHCR